jgi:TatD DNase family protein
MASDGEDAPMTAASAQGGWVDSHCHLDFLDDAEGGLAGALARARAAGVAQVVTIGVDLPTSRQAVGLAAAWDGVHATVGVHPYDAKDVGDAELDALTRLAGEPGVVAIGEVGLDYYREHSPRDAQDRVFRAQIRIAKELGKALVLHVRDALDEAFAVLEGEGPPARLVFHCFSGGAAEARRAVGLGGLVSFAGNVSYKSAESLREAARAVPLDRLLVETDSPYLAPVPHRGKPNEPALVVAVGAALAAATGCTEAEIRAATATNARRVFGFQPP